MNKICHDCHAKEGEYHLPGCDMERCPFCGGQLISCNCCYNMLGIDASEGTWAWKNGLTSEQESKWEEMLETKGRIPWVQIPVLCKLCGKLFPTFFSVSDKEWDKYIIPELQHDILCLDCYNKQKKLFPYSWRFATARIDE